MNDSPLVSVIILTHGEGKFLPDTVESVLLTNYQPLEIIVVDNEANAATKELIRHLPPHIKIVVTGKNLGFAGGNNRGIEVASGEIVILLNDDTRVEPFWVSALVEVFRQQPTIGICGGFLLCWDGESIQHAGGIALPNGLTWHIGTGETNRGQYSQVTPAEYVTGAVFAIHRRVLDRLGLLEPTYFPLYFEEVEYCRLARRVGFQVMFVPKAVVYHRVMETSGQFSKRYFFRYHRNRIRFIIRNFTIREILRALAHEVRWIASGRNKDQYSSLLKSYLDTCLHLPELLGGRRKVKALLSRKSSTTGE